MRIPRRLLPIALLVAATPACLSGREGVAATQPDKLPDYDALQASETQLQAQVSAAEADAQVAARSPDPSDDAPAAEALADANKNLERVELMLAKFEEDSARKQAEPIVPLLPYGLGALAVEAIVAVSSRRKRKLYASAFRNLKSGQLLTSAGDVLRAMGAMHSVPPPMPVTVTATSGYFQVVPSPYPDQGIAANVVDGALPSAPSSPPSTNVG